MAWEPLKGGGRYYTRSQRPNGRVVAGPLVRGLTAAMAKRDRRRQAGASEKDVENSFTDVFREHLPKRREKPPRHACDGCADTGWRTVKEFDEFSQTQMVKRAPCTCRKRKALRRTHRATK